MCGQRDFNLIIMLNHTVISSVTVCTQSAIEQNSKKKVLDVMGDSKVANFTCDSHYLYVITKNRVLLPCVKM